MTAEELPQARVRHRRIFQLVWVVGALLPVVIATPLRQGFDVLGIAGVTGAIAYAVAYRKLVGTAVG